MSQRLGAVALLVHDYDEALQWFTDKLGFRLVEDTSLDGSKRWVTVAPAGSQGCGLVLAKADGARQRALVGGQGGGRVWQFLETDDFAREHEGMLARGIHFRESPSVLTQL